MCVYVRLSDTPYSEVSLRRSADSRDPHQNTFISRCFPIWLKSLKLKHHNSPEVQNKSTLDKTDFRKLDFVQLNEKRQKKN